MVRHVRGRTTVDPLRLRSALWPLAHRTAARVKHCRALTSRTLRHKHNGVRKPLPRIVLPFVSTAIPLAAQSVLQPTLATASRICTGDP
jgi:hypothetical protein